MKEQIIEAINNWLSKERRDLTFIQGHTFLDSLREKEEALLEEADKVRKEWQEIEALLLELEESNETWDNLRDQQRQREWEGTKRDWSNINSFNDGGLLH